MAFPSNKKTMPSSRDSTPSAPPLRTETPANASSASLPFFPFIRTPPAQPTTPPPSHSTTDTSAPAALLPRPLQKKHLLPRSAPISSTASVVTITIPPRPSGRRPVVGWHTTIAGRLYDTPARIVPLASEDSTKPGALETSKGTKNVGSDADSARITNTVSPDTTKDDGIEGDGVEGTVIHSVANNKKGAGDGTATSNDDKGASSKSTFDELCDDDDKTVASSNKSSTRPAEQTKNGIGPHPREDNAFTSTTPSVTLTPKSTSGSRGERYWNGLRQRYGSARRTSIQHSPLEALHRSHIDMKSNRRYALETPPHFAATASTISKAQANVSFTTFEQAQLVHIARFVESECSFYDWDKIKAAFNDATGTSHRSVQLLQTMFDTLMQKQAAARLPRRSSDMRPFDTSYFPLTPAASPRKRGNNFSPLIEPTTKKQRPGDKDLTSMMQDVTSRLQQLEAKVPTWNEKFRVLHSAHDDAHVDLQKSFRDLSSRQAKLERQMHHTTAQMDLLQYALVKLWDLVRLGVAPTDFE